MGFIAIHGAIMTPLVAILIGEYNRTQCVERPLHNRGNHEGSCIVGYNPLSSPKRIAPFHQSHHIRHHITCSPNDTGMKVIDGIMGTPLHIMQFTVGIHIISRAGASPLFLRDPGRRNFLAGQQRIEFIRPGFTRHGFHNHAQQNKVCVRVVILLTGLKSKG